MSSNNSSRKIIGLAYDTNSDYAPSISIKSSDEAMSKEIIRLAKKYRVPIVHQEAEVQALYPLGLDQYIPEKLYQAVAIILRSVMRDPEHS